MKAAVIHAYGWPDELKFEDMPESVSWAGRGAYKDCRNEYQSA